MSDVVQITLPDGITYDIKDTVARGMAPQPATATPLVDSGSGSVGTSVKYAREDHIHPTDTSRQETLVSGTNIKTINGTSLLGSGDLTISDSDENVTQTNTTLNHTYPVIFANNANNTTETAGVRKSGNLTFNPSTGALSVSGSVTANGVTLTGNTGTVTSIGITNGGGVNVSGSPVTGSGNITLSIDNTAQTGYLKKKDDIGYRETFNWGYKTNGDPSVDPTYPYLRLHQYASASSGTTYYGVAFGSVTSSSSSSYVWRMNGETERFEFSNSGFSIGVDQGSYVSTSWGNLYGTFFVGNNSSQYNGLYGFLGKESTSWSNYLGFTFDPYEGEIAFRSYANRAGSDTVINETTVAHWNEAYDNYNKVRQINTTLANDYRVIFSYNAGDTTEVEQVRKSSKLTFNPSTGILTINGLAINGTKNPNTVFAGPSSGTTAATPSFRSLVLADLPSTVVSTTGTQTLTNKTLTSPTINTPAIGTVSNVPQATYISSSNSTYVTSIDDCDITRWGPVMSVYIRFTLGTAIPSTGTTVTMFTINTAFQLSGKYVWCTLNGVTNPYSVITTGSAFLNGNLICGRGLAAGSYRLQLNYIIST